MKWTTPAIVLLLILNTTALVLAAEVSFADVPANSWYATAVRRVSELGLMRGNPDGNFKPSAPVNRAELAVILDRLLEDSAERAVSKRLDVPFTSQAPTGDWSLPYQEACEEASLIMVKHFLNGEPLTSAIAQEEILALVAWEESHDYGVDVGTEDVATFARDFYGLEADVYTGEAVTLERIKTLLEAGSPVIVPAAGRTLANRNYTGAGPEYHMIVLVGFEDGWFFAHDPGTRLGESTRYSYEVIDDAIHDWNGSKSTIDSGQRAMVVVRTAD